MLHREISLCMVLLILTPIAFDRRSVGIAFSYAIPKRIYHELREGAGVLALHRNQRVTLQGRRYLRVNLGVTRFYAVGTWHVHTRYT